jgi:hypothetical protein
MGFFHAQNISIEQPAILHDLETTAYYVDKHSSGYILARRIIFTILKWANMLPVNCHLKVGASNELRFNFSDTTS